MKVVKFLLSVILLISFNLHSQSTYIPMSTGDKFNERGYMQSSSKSISNNEIISDYDGNLSIVYTSPIDVPNGMGGDVTVTYNANVGHRMFLNDINSWSWVNEYGYPVNAPEWIIGYKGFALQTLNFEANFYSHKLNDSVNIQNMQGEETPLLIPGYSYTNKVGNTIDGLPPNYANIDYITLLLSDGSIMTLNNTTDGRVGTYVSSSFDDYTYGVVQLLGNNSYELRKMYLKRGDGLTYYFEEEMTDYYEIINLKSNLEGQGNRYPRTMYLKKVFSPNGDTLSFVYQYVFPQNIGNNHYGRKIFERMITNNGSTFIGANFYLDYITFGFMGDGDIRQIKIFNCSNGDYFCLNIIKTSQGADWFSQIRSNSNTENSKIRYLSSIIIPGGKEDHFGYLRTSKKYRRTALIDDFNFKAPLYKLSNIEYDNGRKTEFAYLDHKPDTPFGFIESGTTATYSEFLRQTQRDCESNLMISRVKKYNKFDGDVFEYQTDYYSYGCPRDWYDPTTPSVHNIWTKITTNNSVPLDSSSPPSVSTTRYFSKYIAGFATSWHGDFTSVIRMEKEVISSASNSMKTSYTFDEGNFNNNGNNYDGTFWLKYKTITDSNFVSGDTFVKTTNYDDYTYQSFNFNPNHAHPYFSKRYKTVEKEIDPYGVITEKRFTSVIPSFSNVSDPFKMNLLNELKIYKGDSIKKIVDYVYNTYNNGSFGKLVRETNYINSRPLVTDYSYYLTGLAPSTYTYLYPNLYKWHLKETVFPNGIKEKYSYTSQEMKIDTFMYDPGGWQGNTYFPPRFKYYASLSLTGKVVLTNGVVKDSSIKCQGGVYSSKPLRTALINGTDSLVYYKLYDDDGNVINEVDVNGFYSEFFYDELGRIKKANLPGSFPASNKIYIDTSVVRYDGYSNINRHYIIGTDSTISPDGEIRIESYGGGAPTQLPDALIENDAKSKDMEQPDGQGDPPAPGEIKPNKYYYGFLKQPIITTNIVSIESASLTLKMAWAALSEGQQSNFDIYGITQDYNLGNLTYQTMGKITVNFVGNTTNSVNVSSILNTIKNNNKNLYGFKFVASVEGNGNDAYKVFLFSNTDTIYLNFSINVLDIDTSNTAGSVLCSYNDNDNKVAITKRFNFDLLNPKNEKSLIEYDALGQLRRKKIMGSNGYEVKADIISNYLGLKSELKDGLSRNQYFKYDDFSRPINQIFISNSPSSPKKTFSYQPSAVFEINTITDETNKSVKKYFDKVGNLKKEEKFNGTTP
ncbi:MAG: hypothetical protein Q8M94_02485, partial [Ignavibacteria bacterium]|nr:hypothetical protein [Ignavibacteria bacterium]